MDRFLTDYGRLSVLTGSVWGGPTVYIYSKMANNIKVFIIIKICGWLLYSKV